MYAAENRTTVPIEVQFSVAEGGDFEYSSESNVVTKVIEPNKVEFLVNVRKKDIKS